MEKLFRDKLCITLLVLFLLTACSWLASSWLTDSMAGIDSASDTVAFSKSSGILLLLLAFLKARIIIVHFMESYRTTFAIRCLFECWVFASGIATIGLLYFF